MAFCATLLSNVLVSLSINLVCSLVKGETRSLDFFVRKAKDGGNFQRRGNQPNTRLRERTKGNIKKELLQ